MSSFTKKTEDTTTEDAAGSFFSRLKSPFGGGGGSASSTRPVPGSIKGLVGKGLSSVEGGGGGGKMAVSSSSGAVSSSAMVSASSSLPSPTASSSGSSSSGSKPYRIAQFEQILSSENIDLANLRKLSWNGIPHEFRPMVWQVMLGYQPTNKSRREPAIIRKRKEYRDSIPIYFDVSEADRTTEERELLRQILVDLPRTSPDLPFFQQEPIQRMMERILYIWSIRHPASGYVQGMNDLLTPLLQIAMQPFVPDVLRCDVLTLDTMLLSNVEADAYWSLTKLLDNIQDHYTFSQPGLQRMVLRLEDLMRRHSPKLDAHFVEEGIQYMQFAFRWMNCLLLRELPLRSILRLWDTYLAEERAGFENFHVYVCAVFLKMYEEKLLDMPFQEILMFLQELPTTEWSEEEIEPVLSQAYILSTCYANYQFDS